MLLEQILRNLLSNAVKFTSRGCILECIRGKTRSISMSPIPVRASRKTRRKPFSGLLQLDNPARDRNRGIGLGLGTVARTARLLGHPVKVTKVGEGSIFTVTVPITEAPVKQPEKPRRGKEQWQDRILAGRTVLVVDDDHAVLTALEMLLEDWGMHVVCAGAFDEVAGPVPRTGIIPGPCPDRLPPAQWRYRRPGDRTGPAAPLHVGIAGLVTGDTSRSG